MRLWRPYLVRDSKYPPGGRDWKFRGPQALELTLRLIPISRLRQWLYRKWPVVPR